MRLVGFGVAVVGVMSFLGTGMAVEVFLLEATLQWQDPARIDGLVTLGPLDGRNFVHAFVDEVDRFETAPLMTGGRVQLTVHQFVEYVDVPGRLPTQPSVLCDYCPGDRALTNFKVEWASFRDNSQVAMADSGAGPRPNSANLEIKGAECAIRNADEPQYSRFPADPNQVGAARNLGSALDRLAAECGAQGLRGERPLVFLVYGIDVWLTSDEDGRRLVKTGTFVEEDPTTGLPRRVTQYVEVRDSDATAHVEVPGNTTVSFSSRVFVAAGQVHVPSGHGKLAWAEKRVEGPVEAFDAEGAFQFGWEEGGAVDLQGQTLNGPEAGLITTETDAAIAVMVIAGVAGLGLLGLALWRLFSRIEPGRLLDHPRRARIHELVTHRPGVSMNQVSKTLGIPWVKVRYHALRMERGGHLLLRRVGGQTALFLPNAGFTGRELRAALLQRDTPRRILELLEREPGCDQATLAERLGLSRARTSEALTQLRTGGRVRSRRVGRRLAYEAVPA